MIKPPQARPVDALADIFSCDQYRLLPDRADNYAALLYHNTLCPCQSVFSTLAGYQTHKMTVHDHSV